MKNSNNDNVMIGEKSLIDLSRKESKLFITLLCSSGWLGFKTLNYNEDKNINE